MEGEYDFKDSLQFNFGRKPKKDISRPLGTLLHTYFGSGEKPSARKMKYEVKVLFYLLFPPPVPSLFISLQEEKENFSMEDLRDIFDHTDNLEQAEPHESITTSLRPYQRQVCILRRKLQVLTLAVFQGLWWMMNRENSAEYVFNPMWEKFKLASGETFYYNSSTDRYIQVSLIYNITL